MPPQAGDQLGDFLISAPLGAGGMGEVYRARDTRLDRDVAIKIPPEAFATDGERLARFEREAKVLASLNHPNMEPRWSPSGDRLYSRSINGRRVLAVDVIGADPLQVGREELLFEGDFVPCLKWGSKWDLHPDGYRFLMLQIESAEPPDGIRVIVNRFTELERLVPSETES